MKNDQRFSSFILGVVIAFSLSVLGFFVWLFWPYPTVTVTGPATLVNEPASGVYATGDIVRWTTAEVCQPSGLTEVKFVAKAIFPTPEGDVVVNTPVTERDFTTPENACITDNPTSLFLPGTLFSGEYQILVTSCVVNPTPRSKCETFEGPRIKVYRPEMILTGSLRGEAGPPMVRREAK